MLKLKENWETFDLQ